MKLENPGARPLEPGDENGRRPRAQARALHQLAAYVRFFEERTTELIQALRALRDEPREYDARWEQDVLNLSMTLDAMADEIEKTSAHCDERSREACTRVAEQTLSCWADVCSLIDDAVAMAVVGQLHRDFYKLSLLKNRIELAERKRLERILSGDPSTSG